MSVGACDDCLRRTALVTAIAGWLDVEWRKRAATARVLALPDEELLDLAVPPARHAYARFDAAVPRAVAARARVQLLCRCAGEYPERLRALPDPPAVLHVVGRPEALAEPDAVAIVGARRATGYGLEVATALGRGIAAAGVPVVSGLALGVDAAAHTGALDAAARRTVPGIELDAAGPVGAGDVGAGQAAGAAGAAATTTAAATAEAAAPPVAVLAAAPEVPYPARNRILYDAIAARGCVLSEFPPGSSAYRWCFVARNRIVAALAEVTVIVEATQRSGSLTTADFAADLGRTVAAVPGRVTNATASGTNGLLQSGAALVRDAADVLELLGAATGRERRTQPPPPPPDLSPPLLALLAAVEDGRGSLGELASTQEDARAVLAGLGELEFRGLVRRTFGGRYERAA